MVKQINSEWFVSGDSYVNFRYFIDDDGIWFNYKDLYELLYISGRKAEGLYDDLYEGNRRIYKDFNPLSNRHDEFKYINLAGLQEIEKRVEEKFERVYRNINILTNQLGLCNPNDENNIVFKTHVDMVLTEINSDERDYDKLAYYAKAVCESNEVQKLKHKKCNSEKEIIKQYISDAIDNGALEEFIIDVNFMDYELYYDFEDEPKITKRKSIKRENGKTQFKSNEESSCPSWLINVVK